MKDIGQQFRDIIEPRLARIDSDVATPMAEQINDRMKENTSKGSAFGSDPYDAKYSRRRKAQREALGLQVSHVDLRGVNRRIETAQVNTVGHGQPGVQISFARGGSIFKEHHTGTGPGKKVRSIFPKTEESVPDDIKDQAKTTLTEVLSGRK